MKHEESAPIGTIEYGTSFPQAEKKNESFASRKQAKVTLWLLYAVCFVEGADSQLLPSSFRALEAGLGLTLSHLAVLGMAQSLSMCIAAPFWGSLIDSGFSGKRVLVFGSAFWGFNTLVFSTVHHFPLMVLMRMMSGVALGALGPTSQSIIAKLSDSSDRGSYFGYCGASMQLGVMTTALITTTMSNKLMYPGLVEGGVAGWRCAFVLVAFLSISMSMLVNRLMQDLPSSDMRATDIRRELQALRGFLSIPSFMVIIVQGFFGAIPWTALGFSFILYLQYVNLSDHVAASIFATLTVCNCFGNILGGYVGDRLQAWSRWHGRPMTAQISVTCAIILVFVFFKVVPAEPSSAHFFVTTAIAFGLTSTWCGMGVNRPILCEIVPASNLARLVAWLTAIDGSVAALVGPSVGILAEHVFGFQAQQHQMKDVPPEMRVANRDALQSAIVWLTALPWLLCLIFYGTLHQTYRKDVEEALRRKRSAEESALL
eukprot:TRINITY_DN32061_c0_g1_i1.p1 TRINITY_DN32061_c0_g1~~TRINITY_DN32061_c0_g1_i1.p1  ORF type:complete len:486 (+),score=62.59 TRINITY_DN32061_c0_g1_i1:113-1570(+)